MPDTEPFVGVNTIFGEGTEGTEGRKKFILEVGKILSEKTQVTVNINGEELDVDYRLIKVDSVLNSEGDPVLILPGFGAGWEGMAELAFTMAGEGREVLVPSLPGNGNSDNPSPEYYKTDNFENEVECIRQILTVLKGRKVHLVGHSMGGEVLALFAKKYPEMVSSLVLLDTAGVNDKEGMVSLASRFVRSGKETKDRYESQLAISGKTDYESELQRHIPESKSSYAVDRLEQRRWEWIRLVKGHLLENIKNAPYPVIYISGKEDSVYPPGEKNDPNSQRERVKQSVGEGAVVSIIEGNRHNPTISTDEITGAYIEHHLEEVENKRKAASL